MSEVQEAEQSVSQLQSDPQGRLRISAPESLAMSLLPDVLPRFQQSYPRLELDLRITGRFVDLVEEGIDVALRVGALDDSSLIAHKLMPCRFHVCASAQYLDRYGRPEHPNDLANHNCLVYSRGHNPETWFFQDSQGKRLNKRIKGNLHSDTGSLLMNAALNHAGIFVAPTFMVRSALERGLLETVLDDYMPTETGLYAVYPYSKLVSKNVRVFVDYLADAWKSD
jgi:DNA-binding transcriptional LysR family regulator